MPLTRTSLPKEAQQIVTSCYIVGSDPRKFLYEKVTYTLSGFAELIRSAFGLSTMEVGSVARQINQVLLDAGQRVRVRHRPMQKKSGQMYYQKIKLPGGIVTVSSDHPFQFRVEFADGKNGA